MRKQSTYVVTDENRDKGKAFLITEMPVMRAEKWAYRAGILLARAGSDIGPFLQEVGMVAFAMMAENKDDPDWRKRGEQAAGRAAIYALSGLQFEEAEPLIDELLGCSQITNDGKPLLQARAITVDDIEEPTTLFNLRKEALILHMGFLFGGKLSTSVSAAPPSQAASLSPNIETFPGQSQPVFRPARRRSRS